VGFVPLLLFLGGVDETVLSAKEQQLLDALSPTAEAQGIEIVTVDIVGSKKAPTIRVYIDCEGGVGFDELASAQEWINALMDEIDPFPGAYTLEVSSPGIDRPLRTKQHFQRFAGEKVALVLSAPVNSRAKYTGQLAGVEGDNIVLDVDGTRTEIPFQLIKKAHVIATIDFNAKKG
jgi:ribosome maturation factor RimP